MANNKAFKVKNGLDLGAYNKEISDTAVDVFVYDTSKDSDGGAWRQRTQATSWYNETLNTATRGNRKEFPAVAVIVAEAATVTIYDGDDPALPMWMVFNTGRTPVAVLNWYSGSTATLTSVSQLNGRLCVGTGGGVTQFDFVEDVIYLSYNGSTAYLANSNSVLFRNNTNATGVGASSPYFYFIVNQYVNDVAMTVLPNAPIDAATGLPVPTIAMATDGGISVITDSGAVYDITDATDAFATVEFTQTNRLIIGYKIYSGMMISGGIPTADISRSSWSSYYYQVTSVPALTGGAAKKVAEYNFGDSYGLTLLDESKTSMASGSVAYVTSSYNTGWMNGDIKLATLSDTDATNVTGAELVTNGTFATDTTGWTAGNGATLAVASGKLQITSGGSGNGFAYQAITTEVGKVYVTSVDYTDDTGGSGLLWIGTSAGGNQTALTTFNATGGYNLTFTATATTHYLRVGANEPTASLVYLFDNISVRLAEEDRSVNGNGLQVFGTVTKTAVATGADLVGYNGFSASNYLEQPYNADLDFGTGDFSIMGWVKQSASGTGRLLDREGGTNDNYIIIYSTSGAISVALKDGPSVSVVAPTSPFGVWQLFNVVRTSGVLYLYVDGVSVGTPVASTHNVTNTAAPLFLGVRTNLASPFSLGSLALLRISATAPTAAQIAKIYEDEKHLFQENAQATLYGSSDAVTALAYDDTTDLLHAGTSAGRSVFQGLRRVDNTTTAVSAAISASNNLVGEQ